MNQRRVDCLKRHRPGPEFHSEQKGEGHWHSGQVLHWGTHRSVMLMERERMLSLAQRKDCLLYLDRSTKGLRALNVIGVFEFSVRLQAS
jgi:hypothetical protein